MPPKSNEPLAALTVNAPTSVSTPTSIVETAALIIATPIPQTAVPITATATAEPPLPTPTLIVQLGSIEWISRAADGTAGNGSSEAPSLSADGRFVAFVSRANNLVSDDSDSDCTDSALDPAQFSCSDLFVYDRQTGLIQRVSLASDGAPANHESGGRYEAGNLSSISGDGRFVAFQSFASNLVANDTNGVADIFVHDRQTGQTERVSIASDGTEANAASLMPVISADGRFVTFASQASNLVADDTNRRQDVFLYDRQTGQTTRVSLTTEGNQAIQGDSGNPTISADGRWLAFASDAANLVPQDSNRVYDIFLHDRQTGQTVRISLTEDGQEANGESFQPLLSADGCTIAFVSLAYNLVANDTNERSDLFVRDLRPLCLTDG